MSRAAISWLDRPSPTRARTSRSRSVSASRSRTAAGPGFARAAYSAMSVRVTPGGEQRVACCRRSHAAHELGGLAVLHQEASCSDADRLEDVLVEDERGEDDDVGRAQGRIGGNPAGGLQSVDSRHPNVHQHHIGLEVGGQADARLAVFCLADHADVGLELQQHLDAGAGRCGDATAPLLTGGGWRRNLISGAVSMLCSVRLSRKGELAWSKITDG